LNRIVIFANGEIPDLDKARRLLRADDTILCADGGTRHALALGVQPNLIIGDMDSAERDQLQTLKDADVPIELFSHDKNETDLELAIHHAIDLKPNQIIIIGALGGRLDQTLGNISLLSDRRHSSLDIRLDDGIEEIFLCRGRVQIDGSVGDLVSLIPWQGPVTEVQTEHLKWPLKSETLYPEKTRGISNEMLGDTASVSIGSGLLLVVHRRT
jgi:thiamine pyrophosphokinase